MEPTYTHKRKYVPGRTWALYSVLWQCMCMNIEPSSRFFGPGSSDYCFTKKTGVICTTIEWMTAVPVPSGCTIRALSSHRDARSVFSARFSRRVKVVNTEFNTEMKCFRKDLFESVPKLEWLTLAPLPLLRKLSMAQKKTIAPKREIKAFYESYY